MGRKKKEKLGREGWGGRRCMYLCILRYVDLNFVFSKAFNMVVICEGVRSPQQVKLVLS